VLWTDSSSLYKGKALKQLVASVEAEEDASSMMHEDFALAHPLKRMKIQCHYIVSALGH
jgi:hypothetical protein